MNAKIWMRGIILFLILLCMCIATACGDPQVLYRTDRIETEFTTESEIRAEYSRIKNNVYEVWNEENEQICKNILLVIAGKLDYDVNSRENMKKNLEYVISHYIQLIESCDESDLLTFLFYKGVIEKDFYALSDDFAFDRVWAFVMENAREGEIEFSRRKLLSKKLNDELKKSGLQR